MICDFFALKIFFLRKIKIENKNKKTKKQKNKKTKKNKKQKNKKKQKTNPTFMTILNTKTNLRKIKTNDTLRQGALFFY